LEKGYAQPDAYEPRRFGYPEFRFEEFLQQVLGFAARVAEGGRPVIQSAMAGPDEEMTFVY
jgi:hypothetical protein